MAKRLQYSVTVANPETGENVTFGPEDKSIPKWAADLITNDGAWAADDGVDDDGVVAVEDHTRSELIRAAGRVGLNVGEDFPQSASKEIIAALIRDKLFADENPDAELTGDSRLALAGEEESGGSRRRGSRSSADSSSGE